MVPAVDRSTVREHSDSGKEVNLVTSINISVLQEIMVLLLLPTRAVQLIKL